MVRFAKATTMARAPYPILTTPAAAPMIVFGRFYRFGGGSSFRFPFNGHRVLVIFYRRFALGILRAAIFPEELVGGLGGRNGLRFAPGI